MPKLQLIIAFLFIFQLNCANSSQSPLEEAGVNAVAESDNPYSTDKPIMVGAERMNRYLDQLVGKRVALVVNQSSRLYGPAGPHLVDTLRSNDINIAKIFALEHGFRGTADAGAAISDSVDLTTGLPIVSLYGAHKQPDSTDLADVDLIVFDIQDVGARFYTYISSLHYILLGAANHNTPVIILDRPNPNGHYIDGPVLDTAFQSFVGMHPVPVVHGMTIGEYGKMILGEGWLGAGLSVDLTVIPCAYYQHDRPYELPIKPSPNLPNARAVLLYPSLCFFEGTIVSIGRGTDKQFQVYGHPLLSRGNYTFTPQPGPGASKPKLNGQICVGFNLQQQSPALIRSQGRINLSPLLRSYQQLKNRNFFDRADFFDLLAGSDQLRKQIIAGKSEREIRADWQAGLEAFQKLRKRYLIYP